MARPSHLILRKIWFLPGMASMETGAKHGAALAKNMVVAACGGQSPHLRSAFGVHYGNIVARRVNDSGYLNLTG